MDNLLEPGTLHETAVQATGIPFTVSAEIAV